MFNCLMYEALGCKTPSFYFMRKLDHIVFSSKFLRSFDQCYHQLSVTIATSCPKIASNKLL